MKTSFPNIQFTLEHGEQEGQIRTLPGRPASWKQVTLTFPTGRSKNIGPLAKSEYDALVKALRTANASASVQQDASDATNTDTNKVIRKAKGAKNNGTTIIRRSKGKKNKTSNKGMTDDDAIKLAHSIVSSDDYEYNVVAVSYNVEYGILHVWTEDERNENYVWRTSYGANGRKKGRAWRVAFSKLEQWVSEALNTGDGSRPVRFIALEEIGL